MNRSGDVAMADDIAAEEAASAIQFTNLIGGGFPGNNASYNVESESTIIIPASRISGSAGNYYIDFAMENIRLISAEVTNLKYDASSISASYNEVDMLDLNSGESTGKNMSYGIVKVAAGGGGGALATETIDCSAGVTIGEVLSYRDTAK
jgi:hypothetical protein